LADPDIRIEKGRIPKISGWILELGKKEEILPDGLPNFSKFSPAALKMEKILLHLLPKLQKIFACGAKK